MRRPTRIHGIDWSGARDAGRHAWVASGRREGSRFRLETLVRGDSLPGSARARDPFNAALRRFIAAQGASVIGFDFPFGVPVALMDALGWRDYVVGFPGRFESAEAFRDDCRARTGGRELKRVTDVATRTPFSAYNIRMYRQTYHGVAGVLAPLVEAGEAVALPMQAPIAGRPWLIETCPASTLKLLGLYRPYKSRGAEHRGERGRILDAFDERGRLSVDDDTLVEVMLDDAGGDALDAALAAVATAAATAEPAFTRVGEAEPIHRREAMVYAG